MRLIIFLMVVIVLTACGTPTTNTPPAVRTSANLTIQNSSTLTKNCPTSGPSAILNDEKPVLVLKRKNHCTDLFRVQWHTNWYTVIGYSLNQPDKLFGRTISEGNDITLDIPGIAITSGGLINGDFSLSPFGSGRVTEDNTVILAVVLQAETEAAKWSERTKTLFADAIAGEVTDLCGWVKDKGQSLVDLIGVPGWDIISILTQKGNCSAASKFELHATPTSQWH